MKPPFENSITHSSSERPANSEAEGVDKPEPGSTDRHKAASAQQSQTASVKNDSRSAFRFRPIFILLTIGVIAALVAFGALPRLTQKQNLIDEKRKQLAQAPWVSVVEAKPSEPVEEFMLPGSTQAILDAPIYARINGYIKGIYVNIGDNVKSGQLLAEIDVPDIDKQVQMGSDSVRQARANLRNAVEAENQAVAEAASRASLVAKARTDLQYATVQLERYKELARQGAVSMEERDTRQTNCDGARSTLESAISNEQAAKAAIKSARAAVQVAKAAMEAAQSQYGQYAATQSFKKVTSPFDGVVTARNVDPGALVTAGSNANNSIMFDMARTDQLKVYVYVPEQFISDVHVGDTAGLTFQTYPGEKFAGTVAYIAGGLASSSRTLQVELHIPNKNHRLMPGMYAQVHFRSPARTRLAVVPGSAVQTRADGTYVFVVDDDNRAHLRKADIRTDLGSEAEIDSGVAIGDKVVLSPSDDIIDGILVNPQPLPVDKALPEHQHDK